MAAPDAAALLAAYDAQLRVHVPDPLPEGIRVERDGPLLRVVGSKPKGFVLYRDLDGLDGDALDELIARQVRVFAERGDAFEWKLHGHDLPADLPERLTAAGLVPEATETVVIAPAAEVAVDAPLPEGVTIREVHERADLERIARQQSAVWGGGNESWLPDALLQERAADPDALSVFVAEAGGEVVCSAWMRFERGTQFATFWGGATLPAWRRRGIYRGLVAHRARIAASRGFDYLEVDALDTSRPILERLGFVPVTTTTPFVRRP